MHCKPCETCPVAEVCAQAISERIPCPIEDATELETVTTNY